MRAPSVNKKTLKYSGDELKQGNPSLFNSLFDDYYKDLCRFAYTYVKDCDAAEEIIQELLISIWENRETLQITTSIRSFLYISAKNRAINYLRKQKNRSNHENSCAEEQQKELTHFVDFCEHEELKNIIETAISELPEQCRLIYEMSRDQNLTYREISEKLNLSAKTVENQMGIALKKLRKQISPYLSCIIALL